MKQAVSEVREVLERLFVHRGASEVDARIFADVLIEAELRGRPTHGLNRVDGLLRTIESQPDRRPRIVTETGSVLVVDGEDHSGYVVGAFLADEALRVAGREGHVLAAARNTRHCGMLGYYADRIVQSGFIAVCFADCAPWVTPWGAADCVLGTNPVAAAFPAAPHPVLIDMGTSAITYGAVDIAGRSGASIPPDVALDAGGRATTDPGNVAVVLPFGGHRGYALGLLVQLLSGVLSGAAGVPEDRRDYGLFMLVMKPNLFAPREAYEASLAELLSRIRSARPIKPGAKVLVPGDRAYAERDRRMIEGIEIDEAEWKRLLDRKER